jgi:hypothetical protein
METSWTSADGHQALSYTYDGSNPCRFWRAKRQWHRWFP